MQRTISTMVGKGSVNHNSRKFKAENVDGSRTHLKMCIRDRNITNIIGNGVAFSVENFVKEIAELESRGVPKPKIIISDRAQICLLYTSRCV